MTDDEERKIRDRLEALNTKAYYLLIALGFLYGRGFGALSFKWALALTAVVAVLPVQDYLPASALKRIQFAKVALLVVALVCTLIWLYTATATTR
jgi:amino acid permease